MYPFDLGLHRYDFRSYCRQNKSLALGDGRTAIFLNTKGYQNDVAKDLRNFLDYVDNKDVENDEYIDEPKSYIQGLSKNTEWRNNYMDNKTHMMFHDEDVREEGIVAGKMEAIQGTIALLRQAGMAEKQLKPKIQQQFTLTNSQMRELFEQGSHQK